MEVKDIKAFLYSTSVSIFINQGAQNVKFNFPRMSNFHPSLGRLALLKNEALDNRKKSVRTKVEGFYILNRVC